MIGQPGKRGKLTYLSGYSQYRENQAGYRTGIIIGVTASPNPVSRETMAEYEAAIKDICSIIPRAISVEALVEDVEPMIEQAPQA